MLILPPVSRSSYFFEPCLPSRALPPATNLPLSTSKVKSWISSSPWTLTIARGGETAPLSLASTATHPNERSVVSLSSRPNQSLTVSQCDRKVCAGACHPHLSVKFRSLPASVSEMYPVGPGMSIHHLFLSAYVSHLSLQTGLCVYEIDDPASRSELLSAFADN